MSVISEEILWKIRWTSSITGYKMAEWKSETKELVIIASEANKPESTVSIAG